MKTTIKGGLLGLAIALIAVFILKDCTMSAPPACIKTDLHDFKTVLKGKDCTYFKCSGCNATKSLCIEAEISN